MVFDQAATNSINISRLFVWRVTALMTLHLALLHDRIAAFAGFQLQVNLHGLTSWLVGKLGRPVKMRLAMSYDVLAVVNDDCVSFDVSRFVVTAVITLR